jgi:hypothetical protein
MHSELSHEDRRRLWRLAAPLALIFWGALFVLLDFYVGLRVDDRRAGVDVLPDIVGLALFALGTGILGFGGHFQGTSDLVAGAVATFYICFFAISLAAGFLPALENLPPLSILILQTLGVVCIVALCWILRDLSLRLRLDSQARRWAVTAALAVFFWPLPQAVLVYAPRFLNTTSFQLFASLCQLIPTVAFLSSTYSLRQLGAQAIPQSRSSSNL